MEMSKERAYQTVAKHIYVAYPTYSTSRTEIIILAENEAEARKKAVEHFDRSLISVKPLEPTKDEQVYEI